MQRFLDSFSSIERRYSVVAMKHCSVLVVVVDIFFFVCNSPERTLTRNLNPKRKKNCERWAWFSYTKRNTHLYQRK